MPSILTEEIVRRQLGRYLVGTTPLKQFYYWLMESTSSINPLTDKGIFNLSTDIKLRISEHKYGLYSESQLRDSLTRLATEIEVVKPSFQVTFSYADYAEPVVRLNRAPMRLLKLVMAVAHT